MPNPKAIRTVRIGSTSVIALLLLAIGLPFLIPGNDGLAGAASAALMFMLPAGLAFLLGFGLLIYGALTWRHLSFASRLMAVVPFLLVVLTAAILALAAVRGGDT